MTTKDEIHCPYCDYVHEDLEGIVSYDDNNGHFNMHCTYCPNIFQVEFYTTDKVINFDTKKLADEIRGRAVQFKKR